MKKTILLVVIALIFSSCYTTKITPEFLIPENQNNNLFSELNCEFDEYSFSSVFKPSRKIVDEIIDEEDYPQREISIVQEDYNSVDAKNLLRKYWTNSGFNKVDAKGTIVFTATFYDFKGTPGLAGISILTFGMLNLVGFPTGKFQNTVEIQASIYSDSGRLLQSFNGFGRDVYFTGVYYYSEKQKRASFIKAVKNAIEEIDKQIAESQNFLAESLD